LGRALEAEASTRRRFTNIWPIGRHAQVIAP
jgi:hypothetical protein